MMIKANQTELSELAGSVLSTGKLFGFRAHGTSMSPFIRDGDTIYLQRTEPYRVGDVVMARSPAGATVHRIVRISGTTITTRGDGMRDDDPDPVAPEAILGKVVKISGAGTNFHLHPPFNRLIAHPFIARHLLQNRLFRKVGRQVLRVLR